MQRYIEQLIEDLQNAKKNVLPEPDFGESYEEFEEKMLEIESTPEVSAKQIFGVSYEELPPVEKLTNEQIQILIDVICDTAAAFKCSFDFPESVPLKLQYQLIRNKFNEDIQIMPGFNLHFDFCSGWCPDCEIADYCKTKDEVWADKEEFLKNKSKNINLELL